MSRKRITYSAEYKAKVVLEVLEALKTINEYFKSISSLRSGHNVITFAKIAK